MSSLGTSVRPQAGLLLVALFACGRTDMDVVQVSDDEARRYFDAHPDDFMRDGMPLRFEEVEAAARRGASDERLRASIAQWMSDLRARAEVVVTTPPAP